MSRLEDCFHGYATEKNCTLIRYDIIQGFRNLFDEVGDEQDQDSGMINLPNESVLLSSFSIQFELRIAELNKRDRLIQVAVQLEEVP